MTNLVLSAPAHYSLDAAASFYSGFLPGSGMAALTDDGVTLAFHLDGSFDPVVVALRQRGDEIHVEASAVDNEPALVAQLGRMLGLDVDGDAWLAVGDRDPVVGKLQREFPGFFTAAKPSPYDAATWAIIAPRIGIAAASRIKQSIAERYGHRVTLRGREHAIFPTPTRLRELATIDGVTNEKVERLHGVARAAHRGLLDANHLLAMGEARAMGALQELRGIGPWGAGHIFHRGAAPLDSLPLSEPRILHGYAHAAGLPIDDRLDEIFVERSAAWRPFRMWVAILCSRHLQRAGKWNSPSLSRERAARGKQPYAMR